uniref:RNA-directed RNA polymerase n=1 Tax=Beihai levi-like virus 2 TaxID=1922405 RepID=A0A1L3KI49_9VIRU|nr:hypothetical protein [Beihai levi-like virus 2]
MKIPTKLLWRVLLDVRLQPSDTIDSDYKYICSRYESEGMSFLTITLPRLDDILLQGLSQGRLTRSSFIGFKPYRRGGSLPALMQGFFRRIFHDDGSLLPEPDTCAIFAIRQVARLFKKVELPCSDIRVKAAYERYRNNDESVDWYSHRNAIDVSLWTNICGYLWSDLEELSRELYCFPGIFGSGATAERLGRNARHSIKQWPRRSENFFPCSYHAVSRDDSGDLEEIVHLDVHSEEPVRVVQVPKTLKTPRTISVEPSYMMLMQQSIAKPLMTYLESKSFGFRSIRFTDQSVNRELARRGSIDGSLSTIDLSDASDLVSNDLVISAFEHVAPTFLGFIQACRSTTALMPDGTILPLRKFASMGSALCFPIEAMVFFSIVMYSLVRQSGKSPSRHLLRSLAKDVAVYGDDIIVPTTMASGVMGDLERFGLRVNHDKSFTSGLFRESCGGDYYKGVDVTPAYVRQWGTPDTLGSATDIVAHASLSNILYMKGMWHACQYIRNAIERRIGHVPLSRFAISGLHFVSFLRSSSLRYDQRLSGYRVKGRVPRPRMVADAPTNPSGFLSLAFREREFSKFLSGFSNWCNGRRNSFFIPHSEDDYRRDADAGVFPASTGYKSEQLPIRQRQSALSGWGSEYAFREPRDFDWNHLAAPWDNSRSIGSRSSLSLIRHDRLDRMYTSERPYSLCLKSKWTASPAGLNWTS